MTRKKRPQEVPLSKRKKDALRWQEDSWRQWCEEHADLISASGIPASAYADWEHWTGFMGIGDLYPDHFDHARLPLEQKIALLRLINEIPIHLSSPVSYRLIEDVLEALGPWLEMPDSWKVALTRKPQTDREDREEWREWSQEHASLIAASGVPDLVFSDSERWSHFLTMGDHYPVDFDHNRLSLEQKVILLGLISTRPEDLSTPVSGCMIDAVLDALELRLGF